MLITDNPTIDVLAAVAGLQRRLAQVEEENAQLRARVAPGAPFTSGNTPLDKDGNPMADRTFRWQCAKYGLPKTGKAYVIAPDAWYAAVARAGEGAVTAPADPDDEVRAILAASGCRRLNS